MGKFLYLRMKLPISSIPIEYEILNKRRNLVSLLSIQTPYFWGATNSKCPPVKFCLFVAAGKIFEDQERYPFTNWSRVSSFFFPLYGNFRGEKWSPIECIEIGMEAKQEERTCGTCYSIFVAEQVSRSASPSILPCKWRAMHSSQVLWNCFNRMAFPDVFHVKPLLWAESTSALETRNRTIFSDEKIEKQKISIINDVP